MRTFAQITRLRTDAEAEYLRCHREVWPTVLELIAAASIANYSIFLGNGILFAYFEYHGEDFEADMQMLSASAEMRRWWRITDPMLEPMADAQQGEGVYGEKWSALREVFHFDPQPAGDGR